MDIKEAASRLKEYKPVRRKSWKLGEYVGNYGNLFYSISHSETYNNPSVTLDYYFSVEDLLADDWEDVVILPAHGYIVKRAESAYQQFFWEKKHAEKYLGEGGFGKDFEIKKVTHNLFSLEDKY